MEAASSERVKVEQLPKEYSPSLSTNPESRHRESTARIARGFRTLYINKFIDWERAVRMAEEAVEISNHDLATRTPGRNNQAAKIPAND